MSKGEQTRTLILAEAVALASEVGLSGLSIGLLADRLNLSKSGLFAHFGAKEELQLATLRAAQDAFVERVLTPALAAPRGLARLHALFRGWFEWLDASGQPGGCVILAASAEFDHRPGTIRDALVSGHRELRGTVAKAVRLAMETGELPAGTDPWQLAFELFGAVLAAHHDRHLFDDTRAAARGMRAVEAILAAYRVQRGNARAGSRTTPRSPAAAATTIPGS